MTARFILSLDCEGKWGVADQLSPHIHASLSDVRLRTAYRDILAVLDKFDISATFAFVGGFAEPPSAFRHILPELRQLALRAPAYLNPALVDMKDGSREGWHGHWAVDAVLEARTPHELALHGVTHVPWGSIDRDFAVAELELLTAMETPVKHARTFVFPRNDIAHLEALRRFGIEGFRLDKPRTRRLLSLASEFNIFALPDDDPLLTDGLTAIPAGLFVNWHHGIRRVIPSALTNLRLALMLKKADSSGAVVHCWLHPENIASAPKTLGLLHTMLKTVTRLRDAGKCEVITQIQYVESRQRQAVKGLWGSTEVEESKTK